MNNDQRIRANLAAFGENYTPPFNWCQSENFGQGACLTAKQVEKRRRRALWTA